jgi:uncharacterized protein (DUF983 family)
MAVPYVEDSGRRVLGVANVQSKIAAFFAGLWSAFRQRCPRCRKGKIFNGRFQMNEPCPECGLIFQREEGYFLGAMYVSYLLGNAVVVPLFFLTQWWLPDWSPSSVFLLILAAYVPLVPAIFRYSRVGWIYFDRLGFSGDTDAPVYEQVRRLEFDRAARSKGESDPAPNR